jgi:selenocysteine lyase/cysteine desulfurase
MQASRRGFLRDLTFSTGAILAFPAFCQKVRELRPEGQPLNEDFWRFVAQQFPLKNGLIYMNAANVAPCALPVLDRYQKLLQDFQGDPSFQNREQYGPARERLREKLALLLGAKADEIALTRNTSEASNIIVQGLDLKAGDEVVVTDHNHPSNLDSWKVRAKRHGFSVKEIVTPVPARNAGQLIELLEKAVSPRTRVVALTHLTNTVGTYFPIREICRRVRRDNVWIHVDGAQTFGAAVVDVRDLGCDSFAGSAHKWTMGPLECGILYVRKERLSELWPTIVTAGWKDGLAGARKLEVMGQRDDPRLVAFEAAVDFLNALGPANVERRIYAVANRLRRNLLEIPGMSLVGNGEGELAFSVIRVKHARTSTKRLDEQLWARARVAVSVNPSGPLEGLRFSPHIYNSFDQADAVAEELRKLCG